MGGVYDVSNKARLGLTEYQAVKQVQKIRETFQSNNKRSDVRRREETDRDGEGARGEEVSTLYCTINNYALLNPLGLQCFSRSYLPLIMW